jgi:hypothetical protein
MDIPKGLKHILEVYRLVNRSGRSYPGVVRTLTANSRPTAATIRAACTTNLGIKTEEFEMFLDPSNAAEFIQLLSRKYPAQQDAIHKFIKAILGKDDRLSEDPAEKLLDTLFPSEQKTVISIQLLKTLVTDFEKWVQRSDVPPDIQDSLKKHYYIMKSCLSIFSLT